MILLESRFMQNISFLTVRQNGKRETKCLLVGREHKIILSRCDTKSSIQYELSPPITV